MATEAGDKKTAGDKTNARDKTDARGPDSGQDRRDILAAHIRASLLSGDTPLSDAEMDAVTGFILDAAATRDQGEAVIEVATANDAHRFMRLAIINDDMPFLVDSIASTLAAQGLVIDRLLHPVVPVRREGGALNALMSGQGAGETRESMIYIETARIDAKARRELASAIRTTLADVRAAVEDWPRMHSAILEDAERISDPEGAALLRWLGDDMLTQLGHVTRKRDGSMTQKLGICRKSAREMLAPASFDRAFAWFDDPGGDNRGHAPLIVKANAVSHVHRRVPIDLFIVPLVEDGQVAALSVHAGIWTSAALASPPDRVPRMRQQLTHMMDRLGFDSGAHTGKALVHALTELPHDLLIGFSERDIERVATAMTSLADRPRPRLTLVEAPLARHLFAFVWLPRDMLSTEVRLRILGMLEDAVGAEVLDWSLQVEGGNLAMIRFVLDIRAIDGEFDEAALDDQLQVMLRGWSEAVEGELAKLEDSTRAAAISARYAESFPTSYRSFYGSIEAARDISRLHNITPAGEGASADAPPARAVRIYCPDHQPATADEPLRLKVYQQHGQLPLSDAVPALENFGFRVMSEIPTLLDGGGLGTIHDFGLGLIGGEDPDELLARADAIEDAIAAVLNNTAENDQFNRLVISAGLSASETDWLRAMYRYFRQGGLGFTIVSAVSTLARNPGITRNLLALFRACHQPGFKGDREKAAADAREDIRTSLLKVELINDDRLLRQYQSLVDAILRTNAFAPAAAEALAFKIDSSLVPGLPKPVPWREIFVYSRRVEGIHLRAGPVARGGLRWSDRRDDFRTEILGLMKAQRVKNAVIVPTGAKGGFYPKQLPDPTRDRAAWAAEGQSSYQVFIRTLLSVTDNIVDDKVVHPEGVLCLDGDDPYFVVAADKGTARFSDVANAIAEERGFWLDDAFASGGSYGYDHKAMGITARGAWISVQRHFREMGVDVQSDPIRVVGCGDMSGDVFGNGMLLSKTIRLVAAFDHRHIFIDPDPDAAKGWKERKRLFGLSHSSWDDYDKALISKGGGVFPRTMKRIPLSPEAREALGVEDSEIEPDRLIAAILAAPADLLWFGGIGTYVKASHEMNAQVGDPTNDALRINASDLRVKVVGEGANLGITQAARIEFGLDGGRINTDFIDNSAGVDCSDNEVNIKIAFAAARRSGRLSEERRNALLVEMTDEVAAIVLEDNRLQALALSVAERGASHATASHLRVMEMLEETGDLDRRTEGLADSETLARRAAEGKGLTRPELAVLLSSAKLRLQAGIEESGVPDDEGLENLLFEAFPQPMRNDFRKQIAGHRLRREIIATQLANALINRLGLVHPFELAEEESVTLAEVAAAFAVVTRLFALDRCWDHIEQARMPEPARLLLLDYLANAVRGHMADVLRASGGHVKPSATFDRLSKGVEALATDTRDLLAEDARANSQKLLDRFAEGGVPEEEAMRVAGLFDLDGAVGLAQLASDTGIEPRVLTTAFTRLGDLLGLHWAQSTAALMAPSDPWERLLVAGLSRDFQQMRLEFLRDLARSKKAKDDPLAAVEAWAEDREAAIARFRAMIGRAKATALIAPAMLAQIASQARNLLTR
ncbi:NAD-glutamate dehydrogenase domain-containing protein [Croceicoccus marinus]|uniref:NAD-glutamate dehydrogenase n=1 Tax=Croceicoccus marinus TaxID=450378 RepID=A0A7G6VUC8_9SPHN|nr:NAD-glutamate dehydrogenase domain-containing protein [Croceicoccus marinus]QNE05343.1 NAD-glutamate dehydrogenase [Croceicoccus marinus]